MTNKYGCVDAGREGCPCNLLPSGKCLICSRMREGNCDECLWQGSCIYTIYQQNNEKIKADDRVAVEMPIVEKRRYGKDLLVYSIKAPMGFCQRALSIGTYVFVRNPEDDNWFDTPISILKSEPEKGLIHLAIGCGGPKAMRLWEGENSFLVRGVYYSGLENTSLIDDSCGESNITGIATCDATSTTLVFSKGVGIAPLRNILDSQVCKTGGLQNLRVYIDLDKINLDFLKDYFGDLPVDELFITDMRQSIDKILAREKAFDGKILALTSPYYADKIAKIFGEKIVRPARGRFCCSMGICGACTYDDETGKTIHLCKART